MWRLILGLNYSRQFRCFSATTWMYVCYWVSPEACVHSLLWPSSECVFQHLNLVNFSLLSCNKNVRHRIQRQMSRTADLPSSSIEFHRWVDPDPNFHPAGLLGDPERNDPIPNLNHHDVPSWDLSNIHPLLIHWNFYLHEDTSFCAGIFPSCWLHDDLDPAEIHHTPST